MSLKILLVQNVIKWSLIPYTTCDNFITFCTRRIFKDIFKCHKTIRIRELKQYCVEKFREEVDQIDWSPVHSVWVDSGLEAFKCRFLDVVNVMAPIGRVRVKQRSSPWFNHATQSHNQFVHICTNAFHQISCVFVSFSSLILAKRHTFNQ